MVLVILFIGAIITSVLSIMINYEIGNIPFYKEPGKERDEFVYNILLLSVFFWIVISLMLLFKFSSVKVDQRNLSRAKSRLASAQNKIN